MEYGESPQKIGMVGCKTSRGEVKLTISAFSFPQFTQIHSRIFLTFPRNPFGEFERQLNALFLRGYTTHLDEKLVLPIQYGQNDPDTLTSLHRTSGT